MTLIIYIPQEVGFEGPMGPYSLYSSLFLFLRLPHVWGMVYKSKRINLLYQVQGEEVHLGNCVDTTRLGTCMTCGFDSA